MCLIFTSYLLFAAAPPLLHAQDGPPPDLQALIDAERAFAKMSVEKGIKAAFLEFLDDQALLFRPRIVNGKEFYRDMPATTAVLDWEPNFAAISHCRRIGYTTGPWKLSPKPGAPPTMHGHYVSIWVKTTGDKWKVIFDAGVSHPKPAAENRELTWQAWPLGRDDRGNRRIQSFSSVEAFQKLQPPAPASAFYRQYGDSIIRFYRDGKPPMEGTAELIAQCKDGTKRWQSSSFSGQHGDCTLGWCIGTATSAAGEASYLRIWRLNQNGTWEVVLDLENNIPKAEQPVPPDQLSLHVRRRSGAFERGLLEERQQVWQAKQTALIVCDVWDKHWCPTATARVNDMAPRMNQVVEAARKKGVLIVHAPSECMKFYDGTPQRQLAQNAPQASKPPKDLDKWCPHLSLEPKLPIDDSDNGCDCDPAPKPHQAWTRQHPGIHIAAGDAVSDSGVEIWNLLQQRGIKNVMILGVHTNMCVLGRPFGLRRMVSNSVNTVLVRDLTDTMYNPKRAPFVSHRKGTDLVVEHIERHVCGTVLSAEIFGETKPRHVVFVIGEGEYRTAETLPAFAKSELEPRGIRCTFVHADPKNPNEFSGIDAIQTADLVVLSVRRRALPEKQLAMIRHYLEEGKPLVGIRTASHAFDPKPPGHGAAWPTFDRDVLGAKYLGHYGAKPVVQPEIEVSPRERLNPLVWGISPLFQGASHLYKNRGLARTAVPLLFGSLPGQEVQEPVAWINSYKGGRIFYTSLGSPEDFQLPMFRSLLRKGILWAMDEPLPLFD